ncbi:MAG: YlbF family regulator [Bacilli bacterium]|nr:YlbF family regulator [Bacilli bacterium]
MITQGVEKKINDLIDYIINSYEYKRCLEIKKQMTQCNELNQLIKDIKKLQQDYIKTNGNSIKQELNKKQKRLEQIPIYCEYNRYLERINEKLDFIKESFNDYFDQKLNQDITERKQES